MAKQYSISDARNNLPSIVKQVEYGPAVELTRRGRPVAVLISHKEYERLNPPKPDCGRRFRSGGPRTNR